MDENTVIAVVNGPGDVSAGVLAGNIVTFVLGEAAVGLRFWARYLAKTKLGWDDWLMLPAAAVSLFQLGIGIWWYILGAGRYVGVVTPKRFTSELIIVYITEINWAITLTLVRASVLTLWRRLFPLRSVRYYCWAVRVINIMWFIATVAATSLNCVPSWALFYPYLAPQGACHDINPPYTGLTVSSIILDAATIAVPFVICWRLQLTLRMKCLVSAMFATGSIVIIFSIVRLVKLLGTDVSGENAFNLTWEYAQVGIWITAESNVAMISGCLPVLRPVLAKLMPSAMLPSRSRGTKATDVWNRYRQGSGSTHAKSIVDKELPTLESQEGAGVAMDEFRSVSAHEHSDSENGLVEITPGILGPASWASEQRGSVQTPPPLNRPRDPSLNRIFVEEQIHIRYD